MKSWKFRKKPVIVEAKQVNEETWIHTSRGTLIASPGDWIITGTNGEIYPCKPDIFEKTYEHVEGNKYQKKPVIIEARKAEKLTEVETLEGLAIANPGDWIITGVNGEEYPCRPEIFEQIYEPLSVKEMILHELEERQKIAEKDYHRSVNSFYFGLATGYEFAKSIVEKYLKDDEGGKENRA